MLGYIRKKLFVSPNKGRKSRKHVRGAKKGRHQRKSFEERGSTLFSEEYDFSGSECVPHDIDVAKWVLGVHHHSPIPVPKTGYAPLHSISRLSPSRRQTHSQSSPLTPPPTPVRTSSRMAVQRLHNYNYPMQSYPVQHPVGLQSSLGQNKNYVKNRINKSFDKKIPKMTEKSNKTKTKTNKKLSPKKTEKKSKHKTDSKSKKTHSKDRSLSRRRQVCD